MPEIVWPEGIKKTKQRDAVVRILESAESPLSAMEINARIEKTGETVWLSTVYRILELFTEKGIVLKTAVLDGDMAYYELNRHVHQHYAVCVDCHKIVPIVGCPIGDYQPKLQGGFRVLGHRVEMYGYCKDCDKRNKV
jgi:Fur family ferric uptake transcriptional regulator